MTSFIPNTLKEYLLQNGFSQASLTLDALSSAGIVEWQIWGMDSVLGQFMVLGWDIAEGVIRKGLKQLKALGLLGIKQVMTRKRGRPALLYCLPSFEAMASQLGLKLHDKENHHSVQPKDFVSVRAYRAGLHRSYIMANNKKKISRAFLGQRLGVGKRTTYNYEQGTDIIATEQLEMRLLDHTEIMKLPTHKSSSKFFLLVEYQRPMTDEEKDIAFAWVSPEARKSFHPMKTITQKMPLIRYLALREERLGRKVYKAWQSTNQYEIRGFSLEMLTNS